MIRVMLADDEELIRVPVIARRTHLSSGTVRNYLAAAVTKLGVGSRAEAFRTAHDNGWL